MSRVIMGMLVLCAFLAVHTVLSAAAFEPINLACKGRMSLVGMDDDSATEGTILVEPQAITSTFANGTVRLSEESPNEVVGTGVIAHAVDFYYEITINRITGRTSILAFSGSRAFLAESGGVRILIEGKQFKLATVYNLNCQPQQPLF